MNDKPHIGFIGLGVMGSRMARTLARAGYAWRFSTWTRERSTR